MLTDNFMHFHTTSRRFVIQLGLLSLQTAGYPTTCTNRSGI